MNEINISVLKCGYVNLRPYDAYINDTGIFKPRIRLPNCAYFIEHPVHGRILVDTGWSSDCRNILPKRLLNFYEPEIGPGETAVEQLSRMGVKPEDIDFLFLTHLDVDHTCALKDFAGKAGHIACAELEYFYSCRDVYKRRQVWDTWIPYSDKIERIFFRASVLGPVKRGFDLFGDDSLICIYCPGHTDGITAMVVSQGPSGRFKIHGDGAYGGDFAVIASDIAFSQRNIDDRVVPGYGFDRQQQLNALDFLAGLQKDPHHVATLFSHDPDSPDHITLYR